MVRVSDGTHTIKLSLLTPELSPRSIPTRVSQHVAVSDDVSQNLTRLSRRNFGSAAADLPPISAPLMPVGRIDVLDAYDEAPVVKSDDQVHVMKCPG